MATSVHMHGKIVICRKRDSGCPGCPLDKVHMHIYSRNMRSLDLCNCFTVRQAARRITRLYEKHLAPVHLTSAQFSILAALGEEPQMTMNTLADAMGMDRTTLLRAIKPLQRDQLLLSQRGSEDPRQLLLSLSAAGKRKLEAGIRLWEAAQAEFETQVGAARAARMRRDLLQAVPHVD
jgi:DNA-binding MarR family transcriptional regulator